MDFFKFSRWAIKKMKLVLLYFRRILFAKNHFKCPFYKKIRANLSGGFLADQWMLYDFDHIGSRADEVNVAKSKNVKLRKLHCKRIE